MENGFYINCKNHLDKANVAVAAAARGAEIDAASVRRMIRQEPCRRTTIVKLITYFNREHGMKLRPEEEFSQAQPN